MGQVTDFLKFFFKVKNITFKVDYEKKTKKKTGFLSRVNNKIIAAGRVANRT